LIARWIADFAMPVALAALLSVCMDIGPSESRRDKVAEMLSRNC
jgi:hypothetical protein